jgi:three-Cys-motif partner protein
MPVGRVEPDRIGPWSEIKLEILQKYAAAYSRILAARERDGAIRKHLYVDAFSGTGVVLLRRTLDVVPGSALRVLQVDPPFSEYHLIDLDGDKSDALRTLTGGEPTVHVYTGDANQIILEKVLPRCRYEDRHRALCLLDPYSLEIDWTVVRALGRARTVEIFYNFMIHDANRNVLWRNPDRVSEAQRLRMDKVWGDRSWRETLYDRTPGLFGPIESKKGNEAIAAAFRERLRTVAGFAYVPAPIALRSTTGAVIYYVYFASPNRTGAKIVREIFANYSGREH